MTSRRPCSLPTASSCSRPDRPASCKDIDVAAVLGAERTLEMRESEAFFRLRNEVLHMIRNETGGQR